MHRKLHLRGRTAFKFPHKSERNIRRAPRPVRQILDKEPNRYRTRAADARRKSDSVAEDKRPMPRVPAANSADRESGSGSCACARELWRWISRHRAPENPRGRRGGGGSPPPSSSAAKRREIPISLEIRRPVIGGFKLSGDEPI